MELRHLHYIVVSARNGSFSAAANELNVRQPIVSKRIREVEDELGIPLFERASTGARLTPTGEEFIVGAKRIVEDVQRLKERARASKAGKLGHIVVGFYKSLSTGRLRTALHQFRQSNPSIEVEPVETSYSELRAGVIAGAIDVAVILGDAGRSNLLNSIGLWPEQLVVALPENHPLAEQTVIYWAELRGERFLISHHDPGPDIRNMLLRHLAAPSDHPEIVTRRLSRESILSEVGSGQGISLQCEGVSGMTGLGVVYRPVHDGNGATRLGYIACWRPDNTNPVLKTFLDALKPKC
ncbi:LysR family transcriptional regulator [Agrobacterium sp. CNPSo 2736]|uniref:LysR substrate-binding domain-containing protein n=1 Tax=Agrobacterium sp. CNPSo 2736 TaxID=2499627 RepID=UPI000FDC7ED3|nr:LysR family transcriptional regulator [Agrobacterium sp. CNPSo 2736]RVT73043.1 LysR family transcriptional regulator [Agrobacterium sp. CNPSo 2736]